MTINVQKVALAEQHSQNDGQTINGNYLGLVSAIEVQCTVRVGTVNLTIAELRQLKSGQVLHLQQKTNDPLEIILNNKVIAKGELMSYEGKFAVRINELRSTNETPD